MPQPSIVMQNSTDENVYITFTAEATTSAVIAPGATSTVTLQPNIYRIRIWGDTVSVRHGTGVFRRHTRYTADWVVGEATGEPLRMGDIE